MCSLDVNLQVYDSGPALALNDVIEVVGFLSVDPGLCVPSEEMEDEAAELHNKPGSLVPRLHAVSVRKLQHNNPLLEVTFHSSAGTPRFLPLYVYGIDGHRFQM
jgi:hypothetical protein